MHRSEPPFEVLYEDNHLLVVNKPAGLVVQADQTGDQDLLALGKAYLKVKYDKPGAVFLALVHRLDRPASGVMVLARTSKAAARLTAQFKARTPQKRYVAIVEGTPPLSGKALDYLRKRYPNVEVVKPDVKGAKRAVLRWTTRSTVGRLALVEVELETGRPHQIRVQLAHRGFPLLGDFRYGATQQLDGRNLALHCAAMTVEHPTRKERVTWAAPPPATWPAWARQNASDSAR
ncbi:MAG: RNA pseudouridine synthase [Bacteroidota bacterium]